MTTTIEAIPAGVWPFGPITASRHEGRDSWHESDHEFAMYCLEVLPPLYFKGGFCVSEAASHTADGSPIYCAVVGIGKRWFAREMDIRLCAGQAALLRVKIGGAS